MKWWDDLKMWITLKALSFVIKRNMSYQETMIADLMNMQVVDGECDE